MLSAGDAAPPLTLPTDSGASFALSGGPAVVFFYPKDDTSGCTREAREFSELAGAFRALGVALLGVSPDPPERHARFKAKHGLDLTLASDPETATLQTWGVWKQKSMYGRSFMGVERTTFLIDAEGRIAEVWRKVSVPGHAEAVLEAARRLVGRTAFTDA